FLLNECHGTTDPRRMDFPAEAQIVDPVGTHGMGSLAGEVRLSPAADTVGVGRLYRGRPRDRGGVLRRGEARPGDGHGRRAGDGRLATDRDRARAALADTP